MSDLFKLELNEEHYPSDGDFHDAFVVCAETERKAWGFAKRYIDGDSGHGDDAGNWLKGAKAVTLTLLGAAEPDVQDGVVLASFNAA